MGSPLHPQINDRLLHQIDSMFKGRSPPEDPNYKFAIEKSSLGLLPLPGLAWDGRVSLGS